MSDRLFCFGLGYSARVLARRLAQEGFAVAGTCREEASAAALRREGYAISLFSREHPLENPVEALRGTTHLLSSVPPDPEGDPVLDCHGGDIAALGDGLKWVGYLSTTGVYGDRKGGWVDEDSPLDPTTERGRRRAAAEAGWLDLWWDHALPVNIFRLASIYGPGRNALDEIKSGRAKRVVKEGHLHPH